VPVYASPNTISFDLGCETLGSAVGMAIAKILGGGSQQMKYHYLSGKVGRIVAALLFMISIGVVSSTSVQAQWWPQNRDRDRDYRRDRDDDRYRRNDDRNRRNGGYGNVYQMAVNQGYQDGVYTGQNDAQRGQNYNPQRSHFYRNGHGDGGGYYGNNGRYGDSQFKQAYRQGFLQGYDQGFRQYGGYNRNNRNNRNGNYGRWPFPW
jgi:hypothetical protein